MNLLRPEQEGRNEKDNDYWNQDDDDQDLEPIEKRMIGRVSFRGDDFATDELESNGTEGQSDAQLQSIMISNYNDYIVAAQRDQLSSPEHEGSTQIQPSYLNETFSSRAPDYCAQEEVERVNNTFRCGSHWTLKKLPTHFEPGSIRTERKAHTMTNLLGTKLISESATKKSYCHRKMSLIDLN